MAPLSRQYRILPSAASLDSNRLDLTRLALALPCHSKSASHSGSPHAAASKVTSLVPIPPSSAPSGPCYDDRGYSVAQYSTAQQQLLTGHVHSYPRNLNLPPYAPNNRPRLAGLTCLSNRYGRPGLDRRAAQSEQCFSFALVGLDGPCQSVIAFIVVPVIEASYTIVTEATRGID